MTQTETRHLLSGDLVQMSTMDQALRAAGFDVGRQGVYPTIAESDYVRALKYLYISGVPGWWNQERDLIERGVCNQRQFDVRLGRVPRGCRLVIVAGVIGTEEHRERVLTYDQMWLLVHRKKADLSTSEDDTTTYALTADATWMDVNYVCATKPRHTAGKWDVAYGELAFGQSITVYSELGDKNETVRPIAVTCQDPDDGDSAVSHKAESGWHEGIEECMANAVMIRQSPTMLAALAVVAFDPKLRALFAANDSMALKQVDDALNAIFDEQGGPI